MQGLGVYLPVDSTQLWARGCDKCKIGIASAPELTGACEIYLERLVQAIDGDITFCDCQAGIRYRSFLANRFLFLKDEVKNRANLSAFVGRNTHPDIEGARRAMNSSYEMMKVPPIRWVDKEVVPPPADEIEQEMIPA